MREDKYKHLSNESEEQEKEIVHEKKGFGKLKKIILSIILLLIAIFIYCRFMEPNLIQINEYKIESELINESYNGFKIVHISDIHYGTSIDYDTLNAIVEKINSIKPDILVYTGDLFDKDTALNEDNIKQITECLNNINVRLYKYAVTGNEDIEDTYYQIMDNSNFILLDNKYKLLFDNSTTPIVLFGFNNNNPDYQILESNDFNTYFKIALTHKPDNTNDINNVNLILAGHSLGGIINIGKPLINSEGSKKYNKKHYNLEDKELFISNGLGTNKYNIRLNNFPSINLYRLYKK